MDTIEAFDHLVIFHSHPEDSPQSVTRSCDLPLESIASTLMEAMKDRITSVKILSIPVNSENKRALPVLGIKFRDDDANITLIKGPISDSEAGKAFQNFWGEKAQLRRIDGDLYECVLWSGDFNVVQQIVDYILQSRFNLSRGSVDHASWKQVTADALNGLLSHHWTATGVHPTPVQSLRLIRSMDKLRSILRGLNDKLPLNVTGILPVSSAFRDTSTFPPILTIPQSSIPIAKMKKQREKFSKKLRSSILHPVFPLYVVITLEQSGRWPDELHAFLHMKRLLLIRIHELLSPLGIPSRVTLTNMLDIFLDGLVFRISIAQPKELRLLQMYETKSTDTTSDTGHFPHTESSLAWMRLNQTLPTISGLISSVSHSFPHVFPNACRLAKRWLSSHGFPVILCPFAAEFDGTASNVEVSDFSVSPGFVMLGAEQELCSAVSGGRMTEIALELLMVCAVRGRRFSEGLADGTDQTNSTVIAFLRFLSLLSTHDWERQPLLVDLNDGFSDLTKRRLAINSLDGDRKNLPAMVICTPEDPTGREWTTVGPSRAGLKELKRLATQSRALLTAMLIGGAPLKKMKMVFQPCFKNLDAVLTLKPELLHVRASEALNYHRPKRYTPSTLANINPATPGSATSEVPPPGARFWPISYCYDPVHRFVHLITCHLGKFCEIRWDRHGGNWIGLKWRRTAAKIRAKTVPFSRDLLDGLSSHKEMISDVAPPQMTLRRHSNTLIQLLPHWAKHLVEGVQQNVPVGRKRKRPGLNRSAKRPKCTSS